MKEILHTLPETFNPSTCEVVNDSAYEGLTFAGSTFSQLEEIEHAERALNTEVNDGFKRFCDYRGVIRKFGLKESGELGYYYIKNPNLRELTKEEKDNLKIFTEPFKASPRSFVTFQVGIQDVVVKSSVVNHSVKPKSLGGSKRGVIKELTRKSVGRMKLHIRNTGMEHTKAFLTLTYPDNFPTDGVLVKRHFDLMKRWLKRHGIKSGIWFLEFQARGAPHFHCFLPGYPVGGVNAVSLAWFNIVGSSDLKHLAWHRGELSGRSCLEFFRHPHAASAYATKYATKMEQKAVPKDYQSVGRFWGSWGTARPVWSYINGLGYESLQRGKAAVAIFRTRFQTGAALDSWMQRAYVSCTMWGGTIDLPELLESVAFGTYYVSF